jgi:transposase-like protein
VLLLVKNSPTAGRPTAAMLIREACPTCGSSRYKKNGHTHHGQQNHQCKAYECQFVATVENLLILDE